MKNYVSTSQSAARTQVTAVSFSRAALLVVRSQLRTTLTDGRVVEGKFQVRRETRRICIQACFAQK